MSHLLELVYLILIVADDVAATSIKRRPFLENFDSDESFRLIKSWLDTCVFHHPGCNSSLISQLPTRIIDVGMRGGQQDPLLFTPPKGYKDSYIALSYCWGTAETKFVLSKENSQLPKLTFPLAKLPKTLRDAIRITQRLGFRFLWVDALCIIQEGDDGEDFLRESATMHEVYGNATLTIAAAAAKNVYEGIFQTPRRDPHPSCKVAYDLPDGTIGTAFVEFEEVDKGGSRLNEPLNTRGWTFQERILSPRVVLFYRDEMSWDCASTLINSNGPLNPTINHNQDSPGRYSDYIVSRAPLSTDQLSEREAYMAYWRTLIAFYSRRTLTNPSDKLRAIAGLAELIKSKTGDSYVTGSGSWQSDLAYQTCWISIELRLQPDPKWDAPSWAWTSCCGKVQFLPVVDVASIESAPSLDSDGSLKINGWIKSWDGAFVGSYDGLGIIHSTPFPFDWNELEMRSLGIVFDREREVEEFFINRSQSGSFLFYPRFIYSGFFVLLLKKTGYFYRRVGVYDFKPRAPGWLVDFSTSSFGDIIIK
jgi:hypothetical protein